VSLRLAALLACALAAALAWAGCSGDAGCVDRSGVSREAYMDELSAEQVTIVCAWDVQKQGGSGHHTCSWGTQTIMTIEECEAVRWPHCPLALFEDCANSLSDVCDRGPTSECTAFQDCTRDQPAQVPDAGVAADAGP